MKMKNKIICVSLCLATLLIFSGGIFTDRMVAASDPVQTGAVGAQGTISAPPPSQGATITIPSSGQSFSSLPVSVKGICPNNLLVKLFKNNVFGGSATCQNGSYSIQVDLFNGRNDLIVRVYDALDQAGPDSNTVSVTFSDARYSTLGPRVSLTSNYAKRGADPGQTLQWPVTLSGGVGPYAISVDWGDGKPGDLISQQFPGTITLSHVYDSPGIYNVVVKATDNSGASAFLQLVGISNGALSQDSKSQSSAVTAVTKVVLWPLAILLPFIVLAFWLGKRHELYNFRKKIEQGKRFDD